MNNKGKIDVLVECYDLLSDSLLVLEDDSTEDETLTEIHWAVKDAQNIINKYLEHLK